VNSDRLAPLALNDPRSRWREAEGRLYPVAMVRPDLYERSLVAVRETVDQLQRFETVEALVEIEPQVRGLVRKALTERELSTAELDLELISSAALNLRSTQIEAASARSRQLEMIGRARARHEPWVALAESGERRGDRAPLPPYHRLEMRVADGLGLHVYVDFDPSTARPVYGMHLVQLDPATGDWLGEAASPAAAEFDRPEPWDDEAQRLRESSPPAAGGKPPVVP